MCGRPAAGVLGVRWGGSEADRLLCAATRVFPDIKPHIPPKKMEA